MADHRADQVMTFYPDPEPSTGVDLDRSGVMPLGRQGLLLIFAFWTGLATLVGGSALFVPVDVGLHSRLRFMGLMFFIAWTWGLATPPLFRLASRFGLEHGNRASRALLFSALGIVIAPLIAAVCAVGFLLFLPRLRDDPSGLARLGLTAARMLPPTLIIYAAVMATGLARDASLRAQARRDESVQLQAHNAQLQAQLAEARLTVLRAQLNPHFLFNTLNAVSGLMDEDPRGARRMVARLSELLRYSLQGTTEQEIPVREELMVLRRYLDIVEIRYQDRLRTSVFADPEAEEALVPTMILQPLAENAMKHGVAKAGGHGSIEVRASRVGDNLVLTVRDTGPGAGAAELESSEPGSGLGIRHTRERLEELYGADQRFELRPVADGGMIAEIMVPFHLRSDLRAAGFPVSA